MEESLQFAGKVAGIFLDIWWVWLPIVLFLIFWELLTVTARAEFLRSMKWVLLEVRVPRDLERTPKAMEQVMRALHGIYRPIEGVKAAIRGEVLPWFSFEIVGINGAVHFFVRTPVEYRMMVERNIYAHYPVAEIVEANDYAQEIPEPSQQFDGWGTEFALTKEDAYPIRTYREFEGREEEEQVVDPLAAVAETLSSADAGEGMAIQILAQPAGDGWQKKGRALITKLLGKEDPTKGFTAVDWWFGVAPFQKETKDKKLSPGEEDVVKALEKNIAQPGFMAAVRFFYWAPRDRFDKARVAAVVGALKQYNSEQLSGFKPNSATSTKGEGWTKRVKAASEFHKKKDFRRAYQSRSLPPERFVLSAEELATVYHYPRLAVEAPTIQRVETKRGAPPADLPVV